MLESQISFKPSWSRSFSYQLLKSNFWEVEIRWASEFDSVCVWRKNDNKKNFLRNAEVIVCFWHHDATMPSNTQTQQQSCTLPHVDHSRVTHLLFTHVCTLEAQLCFIISLFLKYPTLDLLKTWVHKSYFRPHLTTLSKCSWLTY